MVLNATHLDFYYDHTFPSYFQYFDDDEVQCGTAEERALYAYLIALDLEDNGAP